MGGIFSLRLLLSRARNIMRLRANVESALRGLYFALILFTRGARVRVNDVLYIRRRDIELVVRQTLAREPRIRQVYYAAVYMRI